MGAERRPARWRALIVAGCVLSLAACASMPGSGDVRKVRASKRPDDLKARIVPVPPRDGAQPEEIVSGFLEALMSDEKGATTAKQYLTKRVRKSWRPSTTTVVDGSPHISTVPPRQGPGGQKGEGPEIREVNLSGSLLATVDRRGRYSPEEGSYRHTVELRKENHQWRISAPPKGMVLEKANFGRTYHSVTKYYPVKRNDGTATLVGETAWVRENDWLTDSMRALLAGPGPILHPVVKNAVPRGAELARHPLLADGNRLQVRLALPRDKRLAGTSCTLTAAQILYTVRSWQPTQQVGQVDLRDAKGGELCRLGSTDAAAYRPERLWGPLDTQYFVSGEHRLMALPAKGGSEPRPAAVSGPFGDGKLKVGSAAVARNEQQAAAVSRDARHLYVARLRDGDSAGEPLLDSKAGKSGAGLTTPSWDGLGNLWVADRTSGSDSRLYVMEDGTHKPKEVAVNGVGGPIEALRVSAEGSRIAMLVREEGHTTLRLGAIVEDGGRLSVLSFPSTVPRLKDVTAVSWAGDSKLLVAGQDERSNLPRLRVVETDGSMPDDDEIIGPSGVHGVAAAEDDDRALLVESPDGIVRARTPSDSDWMTVAKKGTGPVYPG